MNTKEAAAVLGVPTREILALVDAGLLPEPEDTTDADLDDDSVYRLYALVSMGRRNRKTE